MNVDDLVMAHNLWVIYELRLSYAKHTRLKRI